MKYNDDSSGDSTPHGAKGVVVDSSGHGKVKALVGLALEAQVQSYRGVISNIKRKARLWRLYKALGLF